MFRIHVARGNNGRFTPLHRPPSKPSARPSPLLSWFLTSMVAFLALFAARFVDLLAPLGACASSGGQSPSPLDSSHRSLAMFSHSSSPSSYDTRCRRRSASKDSTFPAKKARSAGHQTRTRLPTSSSLGAARSDGSCPADAAFRSASYDSFRCFFVFPAAGLLSAGTLRLFPPSLSGLAAGTSLAASSVPLNGMDSTFRFTSCVSSGAGVFVAVSDSPGVPFPGAVPGVSAPAAGMDCASPKCPHFKIRNTLFILSSACSVSLLRKTVRGSKEFPIAPAQRGTAHLSARRKEGRNRALSRNRRLYFFRGHCCTTSGGGPVSK